MHVLILGGTDRGPPAGRTPGGRPPAAAPACHQLPRRPGRRPAAAAGRGADRRVRRGRRAWPTGCASTAWTRSSTPPILSPRPSVQRGAGRRHRPCSPARAAPARLGRRSGRRLAPGGLPGRGRGAPAAAGAPGLPDHGPHGAGRLRGPRRHCGSSSAPWTRRSAAGTAPDGRAAGPGPFTLEGERALLRSHRSTSWSPRTAGERPRRRSWPPPARPECRSWSSAARRCRRGYGWWPPRRRRRGGPPRVRAERPACRRRGRRRRARRPRASRREGRRPRGSRRRARRTC